MGCVRECELVEGRKGGQRERYPLLRSNFLIVLPL
jgi:hypothetical protein